jgi:signal transduction histidine kinase
MRPKTKLVVTTTALSFLIVVAVSCAFLGELLRQRVEQTAANNVMQANEVLQMARLAVESGLRADPPADATVEALHAAVVDALRSNDALNKAMNAVVRYSPTVEDVSVTDAHGMTLVSTDPDALNQPAVYRPPFAAIRDAGLLYQVRHVFGKARVLDVPAPLDRNGMPFLVVHVGVRSSFLRNNYAPWMRTALIFAVLAALVSMAVAAFISTLAVLPLRGIEEQVDRLTRGREVVGPAAPLLDGSGDRADELGRVTRKIDRLGREMQVREEGYHTLQTNLDQMLDTLRDGVLMFTADRRAVMVSDAVAHFLALVDEPRAKARTGSSMVGLRLQEILPPETALGAAVAAAFDGGTTVTAHTVTLEDGRQVRISLDPIDDARQGRTMGTLLTLRDTGSALELEQEIEVSRRLAAIGRLTAGVGHEVKNPINAMVVHLELLRGKLAAQPELFDRNAAQRHVNILADEMHRLDRVVETLADFTRPLDLNLREQDLRCIVDAVVDLAGAEIRGHGIEIHCDDSPLPVMVRVDAEFIQQALLNLMLNAMQAMPAGGRLRVCVRREQRLAVIDIADNGIGIPDNLLPRIFDLYFTTKPRGSGIGLAMTYRILQLHGGAMEVQSNADPNSPARGTTFILHLPIAPATESRPAAFRESVSAGGMA